MLKNPDYNLFETIRRVSASLYRYDTYMKDLDEHKCDSCQKLWAEIKEHREKELTLLLRELKSHIDKGILTFE